MKTRLTLIVTALFMCMLQLSAQYCGFSGGTVCTVDGSMTSSGHTPNEDIPCIVRGEQTDLVIQFRNYDTARISGVLLQIQAVRFDSIESLPSGLCWGTNKDTSYYANQEEGCIRITGLTQAPVGQYKLRIIFTAEAGFGPFQVNAEQLLGEEMAIYLRVINSPQAPCPAIDTSLENPYDPGVNADSIAIVSGKIFLDGNQNGVYDAGEPPLRNIVVNIGSAFAITNDQGDYFTHTVIGTYTITPMVPAGVPLTYTTASQTVNVTALGTLYSNDFATSLPAGYCQAAISTYSMIARPGFNNRVFPAFTNTLSETPLTQTIKLSYSNLQQFAFAIPAPDYVDTAAHYISWQVNNVAMGTEWKADVTFYTPASVALGTLLEYVSTVENPSCSTLNALSATEQITVIGSYDPNDKAVSPIGYGAWGGVNPDLNPVFTYKVRFQNTGTFLAENVTIIDTISTRLDISTLRVLSASHNYEVTIEDNRAVKFWFKQIMLADSNSNEPESHGYMQYAIKPYTGLAQDVAITNRADIYFDFNLPVLTNTTLTTIDYVDHTVGIREVNTGYSFALFPNPANNNVQISIDKELIGQELVLTDISGRVMLHQTITETTTTLNVSHIAKGIYLVRMGAAIRKLVKE